MRIDPRVLVALTLLPVAAARAQTLPSAQRQQAQEHYRAGEKALAGEDMGVAEREFQAAVQLDPRMVEAHVGLGQAYMKDRRYPDAVEAFTAAKAAFKRQTEQSETDRVAADRRREDEIQNLRDKLREAQRERSGFTQAQVMQMETRVEQLQREKLVTAGKVPMPPELSVALGSALLRMGTLGAAEHEFQEALASRPAYGEAHNDLAVVYMAMQRWPEAEEQVRQAERGGFAVNAKLKADLAGRRAPVFAAPAPAEDVALTIAPPSVECVVAGRGSRIEAVVSPADGVARARLRFRAAGGHWYAVGMSREEDRFVAVLPRAKRGLSQFEYAVEATNAASKTVQTEPRTARVVADASRCPAGSVADLTTLMAVVRDVPESGPAVPPGFEAPDVPKVSGETSAGVFNLKQGVALAAGVAVAAGAYAGLAHTAKLPDTAPLASAELLSIEPPPGSTLTVGRDPMTLTVRVTPRTLPDRQLNLSFQVTAQFFDGPTTACARVGGPNLSMPAGSPAATVTFTGTLQSINPCPEATRPLSLVLSGVSSTTNGQDAGVSYHVVP